MSHSDGVRSQYETWFIGVPEPITVANDAMFRRGSRARERERGGGRGEKEGR